MKTILNTWLLIAVIVFIGCAKKTPKKELPPEAPIIIIQPASQELVEGGRATFSVEVAPEKKGITLSYQWQKATKGSTDFKDEAGATSESYTTPKLTIAESGIKYRVVITATNAQKLTSSINSGIATITVISNRIVWTHTDGKKKYADVPTNGILLSSILTDTKTDIKSVDTIPSSITSIGEEAFKNCTSLTSIRLPNSVTSISGSAFYNCLKLTSIIIPSGVKSIAEGVFYNCISLKSITLPNSVTSIGQGAFVSCTALTSITLPSAVTSIGNNAFDGCTALTGITLPSGIKSIEKEAFKNCSQLTNVRVEASTPPTAGADIFTNTHANLMIRVPDGNVAAYKTAWTSYASRIYGYNDAIHKIVWTHINDTKKYAYVTTNTVLYSSVLTTTKTDIKSVDTIPSAVTSIGNNAFDGCTALTSIAIPSTVTSIEFAAFKGCSGLMSITIPNSVTTIGEWAFNNCSSLTSITIPSSMNSIGDNVFYNCSGLTSITIPNSVTTIGAAAFKGCSSLTSITIPNSVTGIKNSAFAACSSLTSVRVEATTPPTAIAPLSWGAFDNTHVSLIIRVPDANVNAYRTAPNWSSYKTIIYGYNDVIPKIVWTHINSTRKYIYVTTNTVLYSSLLTATKTDIKSVDTIPSVITSIGSSAFKGCTALTSIAIPTSVKSIEDTAFANCTALTRITIPSSVTKIGNRVFFECHNFALMRVERVEAPSLGEGVFVGVSQTLSIEIPFGSTRSYKFAPNWNIHANRMKEYQP